MAEPAAKSETVSVARYDGDFYAWTQEQAQRMRELAAALHGQRDPLAQRIDFENVAEEIESLGRSDKRAIKRRLKVLLLHLLKWAYQPERRSKSWEATIMEQRQRISDLIEESPSLTAYPGEVLVGEYALARMGAAGETGLPEETFPATCPFTIDQVLDTDWLPPATQHGSH